MDLELTYLKSPDGSKTLTIPEDRKAQAVAFLRGGGRKSAAEIEGAVREGHDALLRSIEGLSHEQAAFKPGPEEWSVLDLMAHVVTGKQLVAALCAGLAVGELPPGFGAAAGNESAQDGITLSRFETLDAARASAAVAQDALLQTVRTADRDSHLDLTFRHFVFGALNHREWAMFQRLHDDNHCAQAGAIRAAAGFPAA